MINVLIVLGQFILAVFIVYLLTHFVLWLIKQTLIRKYKKAQKRVRNLAKKTNDPDILIQCFQLEVQIVNNIHRLKNGNYGKETNS